MWKLLKEFIDILKSRTIDPAFLWLAKQKEKQKFVAFSVSLICLCGKLAKADGKSSCSELRQFRKIFHYPESQAKNVEMLYNLATEDSAGFEFYAKKIARLFAGETAIKEDVFETLVLIAMADGKVTANEIRFLDKVAVIFKLSSVILNRVYALSGILPENDYLIMELRSGASKSEIRQQYIKLAKKYHPDALISRGVPNQALLLAQKRMARINQSYQNLLNI